MKFQQYLKIVAGACALTILCSANSFANVAKYDLTFTTKNQSLWDNGDAFILRESSFVGAQWKDKSVGFDAIVGNEETNVPNPLRLAYNAAFESCRALGLSSSACVNGQSARVPVPALGSRPSIRSCSRFAFACKAARLLDQGRAKTYDLALSACKGLGFSSSVCRNGQSGRIPFVALGVAPPQFLEVDTRTGAALTANSDGKVGIEFGIQADSGSVNAELNYEVAFDIPDTLLLDKTTPINFNPRALITNNSSLETQFSNVSVSVDAIMELNGDVTAEGCFIGTGCVTGGNTFNINERASILSFNQAGEGGIELFGRSPSFYGLDPNLDGFPFEADIAGLAELTLHLPQPNASGGLNARTGTLVASGQDDFIDLSLDVDNIISSSVGLPSLFGRSFDIGSLGSVSYDIIDVSMGPSLDLKQNFELDPTLYVSMAFDKAVEIGGELVTEFISAWDNLPSILFKDDVTTVSPTFFVEANLKNETLLDLDFDFGIDILQLGYDFVGGLKDDIGITLLDNSVDVLSSPNFYQKVFPLAGFDLQIADSFTVDFTNGSTLPSPRQVLTTANPVVLQGSNSQQVNSPSALLLLLLSFFAMAGLHLKRTLKGKQHA